MDTDSHQVRLSAIGIVAVSLFLVLLMRLWFLQGIDRQEFEAASVSNRLRVIHEEAPRGRILDRNGKVLVDNRTSIVVSLDREPLRAMEPDERQELFVDLADTLASFGVPTKLSRIEQAFEDKRYAPQAYVPVAEEVPEQLEMYLLERRDRFPGVEVERTAVRVYPYGKVAVHLLGYVGEINEQELLERGGRVPGATSTTTTTLADERPLKEYQLGDSIGKTGVERSYEEHLRGIPGKRTIEVNARGELVDVVSFDPPVQGEDLWLTIDIDLQAHAERVLASKIESLRGQVRTNRVGGQAIGVVRLNAPQGSVVVQDPANGQILAMASYPDYPPESVVNGISSAYWEQLNDPNSGLPLNNWALQGTYAPGSTFKLFTAHAAQRTGLLAGGADVINDPGFYEAENCTGSTCRFRNAGSQPYGRVDLTRSLIVSSDVYYYRIADKFWNRRGEFGETPIQDAAAEFGLGSRTGIPLPGENPGRLPTPEARKAAYDANPELFLEREWRTGDNINMSIGQGDVLATPLQLANAYATFANGGTRYRPQVAFLVTRAIDPTRPPGEFGNFEVVRELQPEVEGTVAFDLEQYRQLYEGLAGVTRSGTAASAFAASPTAWPMAGKTGTAQVNDKADTALFVGFGPAEFGQPARYAISVVVPEAGFGGEVAAPIAFRVLAPVSDGSLTPACPVADQAACEAAAEAAAAAAAGDARLDSGGD
jgi:penicillin-binding protein 2